MTTRYCTLFDSGYAARGLTMLRSLQRFCSSKESEVIVLALDDAAADVMREHGGPGWRIISIDDLADARLSALRHTRPYREFCWTCTPALSNYLVQTGTDGDIVCYLDADMMFFADPQVLLQELSGESTILVHEHRYSPDKKDSEIMFGRFNVGFVAFRVGGEARQCAKRWRDQTIDVCVVDPEKGLCGDQKYLDEWPSLYPGLRIMKNIGGGVAPWNVNAYSVTTSPAGPAVNGTPVVFFHYHAVTPYFDARLGLVAVDPADTYTFSRAIRKAFYRPYLVRLAFAIRLVKHKVPSGRISPTPRVKILWGLLRGRFMLTFPVGDEP